MTTNTLNMNQANQMERMMQEATQATQGSSALQLNVQTAQANTQIENANYIIEDIEEEELERDTYLIRKFDKNGKQTGMSQVKSAVLADIVLRDEILAVDSNTNVMFYNKSKGIWESDSNNDKLKAIIAKKYLGADAETKKNVSETVEAIINQMVYERDKYEFKEPVENIIVLKNGVYNTETKEFTENGFSPEYFAMTARDFDYDANATAPKFLNFLNYIFEDDNDKVLLLLEFMGYSLTESFPSNIQKFMLIQSDGGYGKSALAEMIESVASSSVSHVPLEILNNQSSFAIEQLRNKTLNIDGDMKAKYLEDASMLKMLVGGDTIFADIKYQKAVSFKNKAKLLFLANTNLNVQDSGGAVASRMILVRLHRKIGRDYEDSETRDYVLKNMNKADIIANEKAGMFNLAMKGLDNLYKNGRFTYVEEFELEKQTWAENSDVIQRFLNSDFIVKEDKLNEVSYYNEVLQKTGVVRTKRTALYSLFKNFVQVYEGNKNVMGASKFYEELRAKSITAKKYCGIQIVENIGINIELVNSEINQNLLSDSYDTYHKVAK